MQNATICWVVAIMFQMLLLWTDYLNRPVRLDIIDEAGGMLKSVNRGGATYNAKMADILAELYTTSTSIFLGRQTAEGNKGRALRPNVNLLCSTTPTGFSEGVTVSAIEKGLMGRFLIFIGDGDKKARRVEQPTRLDTKTILNLQHLAVINLKNLTR